MPEGEPPRRRRGFVGELDNCRLAKWAYDRHDVEPQAPLTYLAAANPADRDDVADDPLPMAFVR